MVIVHQTDEKVPETFLRFHHGTDAVSANDLWLNGVNHQHAAGWNGSGEFWATTIHKDAEWFAFSHPGSPPAACFEFELSESIILVMLQMCPPGLILHASGDYEFLPGSFTLLNQHMTNSGVVPVT